MEPKDDWLDTEPTFFEWVVLVAFAAVMFALIQVALR
jgi:hypothetical protein